MKYQYIFLIIPLVCFLSCAKTDIPQKIMGDNFNKQNTDVAKEEVGRRLQDFLFCDRLDFDNTISQSTPVSIYHRELIPYFREPGDRIYKYLFIETHGSDIRNFEFIVSKEAIKSMDLYSETIHNDSMVIRTPGMRNAFKYEVIAKLNNGYHKINELEKKLDIPCKDNRGLLDWYWMVTNKKTGSVVSKEYVGQTIYLCGIEGVSGRFGTGKNKMDEEWLKEIKQPR